ncbi:MAG: hydrolase [Parcubacteria group bacterium]|nr:hydrolase [Parcubacteria group bacterium]
MPKTSTQKFYKPSITADVVVFTIEDSLLKVLTVKRADEPFKGTRALPGGFILPGSDSMGTARRILKEKAGLEGIYMEQLYTFDDPKRDPRGSVVSVAHFALVHRDAISLETSSHTQDPTFTPLKHTGTLAFDHKKIIEYAYERLRGRLEYTNIAQSLLPKEFTFSELQNVYETIFSKKLDKRNFRKKIERLGLIKATKKKIKRGRQRPALLYTFASGKAESFKNPF